MVTKSILDGEGRASGLSAQPAGHSCLLDKLSILHASPLNVGTQTFSFSPFPPLTASLIPSKDELLWAVKRMNLGSRATKAKFEAKASKIVQPRGLPPNRIGAPAWCKDRTDPGGRPSALRTCSAALPDARAHTRFNSF